MAEKRRRGAPIKLLYEGFSVAERMIKIPEYKEFQERAKKEGVPVVELLYRILLKDLEKYKNDQKRTERNGRLASTNELSKDNSRNSN
jgi:hypothetical protein